MTTKSNRARRAPAKPSLSAISLGRALLLYASATTALNASRPVTNRSTRTSRESARSARRSRRPLDQIATRPSVELHYRDGNEDQSAEMRSSGIAAVENVEDAVRQESAAAEGGAAPQSATSPRGYFTLFSATLPNIVRLPPATEIDERQAEMDDYVKFAAARYSRLHAGESDREKSSVEQSGPIDPSLTKKIFFSTLAIQRKSFKPMMEGRPREEDPLQVLGLSGLASERLKQRLHLKGDPNVQSIDAYQMPYQRMMSVHPSKLILTCLLLALLI